jgi:hypothetical protein
LTITYLYGSGQQQPYGWPGEKLETDIPTMVNIRQDPFERLPSIRGETFNTGSPA